MNVEFTKNIPMKPIKYWLPTWEDIEESCQEQALNLAQLPFIHKHVALMPDTHAGYGMPIGGVIATRGVVIPNAVGVDIGCGMIARKLNIKKEVLTEAVLKNIIGTARKLIPVGFTKRPDPIHWADDFAFADLLSTLICQKEYKNSTYQVGTLGGGNHFIEIQTSEEDDVWLMIHSGSRNLGKQICDYYNKAAVELNAKYFSSVPAEWQLAFLPVDSSEGITYLREMNLALEFASFNRQHMMDTLFDIIKDTLPSLDIGFTFEVNAHHNYCALENHFGENVYVHRKGAIRVREGELGIIPGSMGTPSYIVKGLGNPESFHSASHGAGRKMSRTEVNNTFSVEEADKSIEGVLFGRWGNDRKGNPDISECPLAYKDIDQVIANEKDLVTPIVKLRPLAVMKG